MIPDAWYPVLPWIAGGDVAVLLIFGLWVLLGPPDRGIPGEW